MDTGRKEKRKQREGKRTLVSGYQPKKCAPAGPPSRKKPAASPQVCRPTSRKGRIPGLLGKKYGRGKADRGKRRGGIVGGVKLPKKKKTT